MPRLFRQKLSCFYCGSRSAQDYSSDIRKWKCEKCEALNYLDENGEITDPPPLDSFSEARYAQSVPRAAFSELVSVGGNLFCAGCLQNQKFLTEALASYFPPINALDYPDYEANYPVFRKNLEDRYPQVCRQCEPRVRDRIRLAGYAAKTDHLRRMMERSRNFGRYQSGWSWKSFLISAGTVGWWTSLIGQILWDVHGSLTANQEETIGDEYSSSILACLQNSWTTLEATSDCAKQYDFAAGIALGLDLIFLWWNPALDEKFRKRAGRIVGLMKFYALQAGLLAFRYVAWSVLTTYNLDIQTVKAIHAFMIVFASLTIVISFRTVQLDLSPRVLFQDGPNSPQGQQLRPADVNSRRMKPNSNKTQASTYIPPFSVRDLAPTPQRLHPSLMHPPTPPPDDDETEAMDWTPSQKSLPPARSYHQPKPIPAPSPFYGEHFPAPKSQAQKSRYPALSTYPRASSAQKENLFGRQNTVSGHDEFSELGSEASDTSSRRPSFASPVFAHPKFFPRSAVTDTGLESLFSQTFSIAEEPREVRIARHQKGSNPQHPLQNPTTIFVRLLSVLFLSLSVSGWVYAPFSRRLNFDPRLPSLGVPAAVASLGIWQLMWQLMLRPEYYWRWIAILVYISELCTVAFITVAAVTHSADARLLTVKALFTLCVMLLQESLIAVSQIHNASKPATDQFSSEDTSLPSSSQYEPHPDTTTRQQQQQPSSFSSALSIGDDPTNTQRVTRSRSRLLDSTRTTPSSRLGGLSLG